jgi:hypothetical protein
MEYSNALPRLQQEKRATPRVVASYGAAFGPLFGKAFPAAQFIHRAWKRLA